MPTGKVLLTSDLKRKQWVKEGMLQARADSFWSPLTAMSPKGIVYQKNTSSANGKDGHEVVFDYRGNASGKPVKGNQEAFGTGETKKKFSDSLRVNKYRFVMNNGNAFDAVDSGDLSITAHSDSRSMLSDLYIRWKDQMLFDSAQGVNGQAPTHIIDLGTSFGVNEMKEIEKIIKTSNGFNTGSTRRPLEPFKPTKNGQKCWIMVVDAYVKSLIEQSNGFQSMVYNADVRGSDNLAFQGLFGKIGQLYFMEAPVFFGDVDHDNSTINYEDSGVEIAGLRQYDSSGSWTGQSGFDPTDTLHSRCLVLGANAIQFGMGKQPDYKYEERDFGAQSESCLEVWTNAQKTILTAENVEDYNEAKVAGTDYGVIAVDIQVQA